MFPNIYLIFMKFLEENLLHRKVMFRFQDIQVFEYLTIP